MNKQKIELGFGVSIEKLTSDDAVVHNLKSNKESVSVLGVKLKWN